MRLPQAGPGLLLRAESEHPDIDLGQSVTVGDAESDIDAGRGAGTQTIRLSATSVPSQADHVVRDLRSAVRLITGPPEHYHHAEAGARPVKIAIVGSAHPYKGGTDA